MISIHMLKESDSFGKPMKVFNVAHLIRNIFGRTFEVKYMYNYGMIANQLPLL